MATSAFVNMFLGTVGIAFFLVNIALFGLFIYSFILWLKVLRRAVKALDIYLRKNENDDNSYNSSNSN
ncbi:MAG: hypothetical protein FWE92_03720 [Defluviitaleaceae bacterium]|nr:hypothetical protein [Defluviitaleaceae bacterium]